MQIDRRSRPSLSMVFRSPIMLVNAREWAPTAIGYSVWFCLFIALLVYYHDHLLKVLYVLRFSSSRRDRLSNVQQRLHRFPFGDSISLATVLAFTEFGAAYVVGYALMAQALISLLCIFILYFVNRHRTKILTTCGGGELTLRYQLAENIKAMKALIPFLLLDNMITWNDQLFDLLFEVNYLQPPILCTKSTNNLLFLVSTTVSLKSDLLLTRK
ncbi:unnamed protein product, partial [Mesorhabditis belari]|uniref:Uncharacterized protein n=1 Tax=Mesorhabditis belari TaxID=2138241 RepID=A0AAF3FGX9_9BILA